MFAWPSRSLTAFAGTFAASAAESEEWAADIFESDEEPEAFLADLPSCRFADLPICGSAETPARPEYEGLVMLGDEGRWWSEGPYQEQL